MLSVFPRDIKPAPRSYAEAFPNVREYMEHPAGGHFAAWEQPEAYADDLRRAVRLGSASLAPEGARCSAGGQEVWRNSASATSGHVTRGTPWPMPGSVSRVAPGISAASATPLP